MSRLFQPRRLKPDAGFTLIELLLVIVIIGILLGVGIPSFRTFTLSQKVKAASVEVSTMLILARSEAIKRNKNVVIAQATGGWQNGWTVTTTDPDGNAVTLNQHEAFPSVVTVTNATASITYANSGRAAGAGTFTIQSSPATTCRSISVSVSGGPKTASC